jgi:Uma2 family endonuclease
MIHPASNALLRCDVLRTLPATKRLEILDGRFWDDPLPGARHQAVVLRLAAALSEFAESGNLGKVLFAPYPVFLSRCNVIQPDILFVRRERRGMIGETKLWGTPDLVVEVMSPHTREKDLRLKRSIYSRFEIPEYWIADPDNGTVEVLIWSEMGYASAGARSDSDALPSRIIPAEIRLSGIEKG